MKTGRKKSKNTFSYMNPKLEVRETKKYGKGVFAKEDIKKGERIHVLNGEKVSLSELLKRLTKGKEWIDDPLQVGKKNYIDLDDFSRIFNHSCDPNAGMRKRSELFALRNIKKEEEITYDYSATIAPTEWEMKCKCGAKKCRKILGDVLTIPKSQLMKYRKLGSLQNYIKNVLDTIKKDSNGKVILPKYEVAALKMLKNGK